MAEHVAQVIVNANPTDLTPLSSRPLPSSVNCTKTLSPVHTNLLNLWRIDRMGCRKELL